MSTYTLTIAVAEIPAAFFAAPRADLVMRPKSAHITAAGTGMTDVVVGQARRPRGIPL
jgi:hypothetical protein